MDKIKNKNLGYGRSYGYKNSDPKNVEQLNFSKRHAKKNVEQLFLEIETAMVKSFSKKPIPFEESKFKKLYLEIKQRWLDENRN